MKLLLDFLKDVLAFLKVVHSDGQNGGSARRVGASIWQAAAIYIAAGGEHVFGLSFSDSMRIELVMACGAFSITCLGLTLPTAMWPAKAAPTTVGTQTTVTHTTDTKTSSDNGPTQ